LKKVCEREEKISISSCVEDKKERKKDKRKNRDLKQVIIIIDKES